MKITIGNEDGTETSESIESFNRFTRNDRFTHFICMATRPGLLDCVTLLEHRDYKPFTERNKLFFLRSVEWESIFWIVVSMPTNERHLMEQAVKECGLRIANGLPAMLTATGMSMFPIDSPNAFSLENVSGHPVYRNNPEVNRAMRESEIESARRISKNSPGSTNA